MPARFAIDKTIVIHENRFHYRDWGGEGRLFVLLHDVGSTAHVWNLVAPLLVERGHVIALDLRGHGQSDKQPPYTFQQNAADLLGLLAELAPPTAPPPVLVGHGWGARVALHAAAHTPLEPALLTLIDGGVIDMRGLPKPAIEARYQLPKARGEFEMAFRERIIKQAPQGVITPAVEAAIMARYIIGPDDQVFARLLPKAESAILEAISQQALDLLYAALATPLLLILSRSTPADPDRQARIKKGLARIEAHTDDVTLAHVPASLLELPLQRPHAIVERIRSVAAERL
jgi:pimeloyl-ACP methyl ester carboxylesterase